MIRLAALLPLAISLTSNVSQGAEPFRWGRPRLPIRLREPHEWTIVAPPSGMFTSMSIASLGRASPVPRQSISMIAVSTLKISP